MSMEQKFLDEQHKERSERGRLSKRRGHAHERAVVNYLRKKGYDAWRSAGSLGPFDVIAIPLIPLSVSSSEVLLHKPILLIQAKSSKPTSSEMEMYRNYARRLPLHIHFEIWVIPYRGRVDKAERIRL